MANTSARTLRKGAINERCAPVAVPVIYSCTYVFAIERNIEGESRNVTTLNIKYSLYVKNVSDESCTASI